MTKDTIKNRLELLRGEMKQAGIDAYLIPSDDDHASEYVNDHFKVREWISGFTGSAGTALITADEAFLWTDGRYFLQAADQLQGTTIELMKMGEPGVPTIKEKITELAEKAGSQQDAGISKAPRYTLGFCGATITAKDGEEYADSCPVNIAWDKDLADSVWDDRPELKASEVWDFPLTSCGKSREEKLAVVRAEMKQKDADILLISDLMETAWLTDLRGGDILNTPVFYSYTIVTADECYLFALPGAVSDFIKTMLAEAGIICRDYDDVTGVLLKLCSGSKTVWADKGKTSYALMASIADQNRAGSLETKSVSNADSASDSDSVKIIDEPTPIEMMKALKNETEIAATENAHLKDGVAVTKFLYWLKHNVGKEKITEISASDVLESLRREQEGCFDLSFPTIAGYNSNGAIIHYEPTPESDTEVDPEGFLLVDSGGQYIDGTTDITRTIAVGPLSDKMKEYYTLVLKGHIDLAMAEFPEGTAGKELDALARKALKAKGLDYNHGTGHGVGHVLSVHEGPCYISFRNADIALKPGMITSDEPGVYIENEFGVRIENEVLCISKAAADADLLAFKTLTLVPYEIEAIVPEMLTDAEKEWLNSYHKKVHSALTPYLTEDEAEWLKQITMPI